MARFEPTRLIPEAKQEHLHFVLTRLVGFTPEAMEKNQALVDLLKRIAQEKHATPAQIALACRAVALDRADPRHHQVAPA
jgi:aryl-alcohol dehydrogenase-like predicted oxidoreductase